MKLEKRLFFEAFEFDGSSRKPPEIIGEISGSRGIHFVNYSIFSHAQISTFEERVTAK